MAVTGSTPHGRRSGFGAAVVVLAIAWAIADLLSLVLPAEFELGDRADVIPGLPLGLPGAIIASAPALILLGALLGPRIVGEGARLRVVAGAALVSLLTAVISVSVVLALGSLASSLMATNGVDISSPSLVGFAVVPILGLVFYGLPTLLVVLPATWLWMQLTRRLARQSGGRSSSAVVATATLAVFALRLAVGVALPTRSVVLTVVGESASSTAISWSTYVASYDALWDALEGSGHHFSVGQTGATQGAERLTFWVTVNVENAEAASAAIASSQGPLRLRVVAEQSSFEKLLP